MVESEWNMALATLYRISNGIDMCNEGLQRADFLLWLKGIYLFYGELSTFMSAEAAADFMRRIDTLKLFKTRSFDDNLFEFFMATLVLRKEAHKHKLLLKEAEDTTTHGGKI